VRDADGKSPLDQMREEAMCTLDFNQPVVTLPALLIQRHDGTRRNIENRMFPIHTAQGILCGVITRDVTESLQTEQELRLSQERYELATRAGKVGVWDWDLHGEDHYVDPGLWQLYGYEDGFPVKDVAGLTGYVPAEDLNHLFVTMQTFLANQESELDFEFRVRHADGTMRWLQSRGMLLRDENGQPSRLIGTATEVTERKRAEAAYHALVDHSLQGLFIMQSRRIVFINQAMADITGYPVDRLLGLSLRRVLPRFSRQDRARILEHYACAMKGEQPEGSLVVRAGRQDGTPVWVEIYASPVEFQGQPAVQAAVVDITERVAAETALRESRQRLQSIIDHIPQAVFWKDRDLVYQGCNNTFLQFMNLETPDDVIGKTDNDLFQWTPAFSHGEIEAQVIASGQSWLHHEHAVTLPGDDHRWISANRIPLRDADGTLLGLIGTFEDITERKAMEQQQLALALEREKVSILSDFIDAASHEFKTPMSVINTAIFVLERLVSEESQAIEQLSRIRNQTAYIRQLIEGMLTMSRLDTISELDQHPTDVNALLRNVSVAVQPAADRRGLAVTFDLAADLPAVMGNARDLQAAFQDLVRNAIQYTPSGGAVTVRSLLAGDEVIVDVSDTGIGIAPDDLPRIFERFFRAEKARTERGAGLGLTIAHRVIDLHGGRITVESQVGQGSTFVVKLPAVVTES
jgi:PAS domain S-box-containing protein